MSVKQYAKQRGKLLNPNNTNKKKFKNKNSINIKKSQSSIHKFLKISTKKKIIKPQQHLKLQLQLKSKSKSKSQYENVTECPVCCKQLNGLSIASKDIHVNMCLDISIFSDNNNNNKRNKLSISSSSSAPSFTRYAKYNKYSRKHKLKRYYTTPASYLCNNGVSSSSIAPLSKLEYYCKYKVLNGNSNIIIDGFSGYSNYKYPSHNLIFFLTHYHSDHYAGLKSTFKKGVIYCSEITAQLLNKNMFINSEYIVSLPMFTKCLINNSNPKTYVTLLEANHCPGAVMFLFEMNYNNNNNNMDIDEKQLQSDSDSDMEIQYHLHVGDARLEFEEDSLFYNQNHSILSKYYSKIDKLYLDTTYCDTKTHLPRQSDAIDFIVNKIKYYLNGFNNDIIILIGTYSIGKERILHKINVECDKKIFITPHKQHIFSCLYDDNKLNNIYTNNKNETNIYVVGMNDINFASMWQYKKTKNTQIIGFRPTGWANKAYKHKKREKKHVIYPQYSDNKIKSMIIYEVPYSEHSSFVELCKFVKDINPKEIIPTVNNKSNITTQNQTDSLNKNKNKIEYTYQPLVEQEQLKQTTLNDFNFSQTT